VTNLSPVCTIAQSALPGKTLVAPEDGVIRQWSVRNAQGEFALAVLTPREDGEGQLALSQHEFVGDPGVHTFKTELRLGQGDHVGLVMWGGSGIGVRDASGATVNRWIPRLKGTQKPTHGKRTGFDKELLLRVDYVPGARQRTPQPLTGAAAAKAEPGKVIERTKLRYSNGRPTEIRLVGVGPRVFLEQIEQGRRTARIAVPDFVATNGESIYWEVYAEEDRPQQIGAYMEWRNEESARILNHFYDVFPHQLEFIN
jgi:hypothetical protein